MWLVFFRTYKYDNRYAVNMQPDEEKLNKFKVSSGVIFEQLRKITGKSQRRFADEYDIDRGNLSKIEHGIVGCSLSTAWKIAEAAGVKFSDFAKMLENNLGDDFTLIDE